MADEQLIKPRELPAATTVFADDAIMTDDGVTVGKATPVQIVNAGAPVPTEAEAIAGTDNSKRMTPLTVKQVLDSVTAPSVLRAQAWAESGSPPDPGIPGSMSAKSWAEEAERLGKEQVDLAEAEANRASLYGPLTFPSESALLASNEVSSDKIGKTASTVSGLAYGIVPPGTGDFNHPVTGVGLRVKLVVNTVSVSQFYNPDGGVGDATAAVQKALDSGAKVVFLDDTFRTTEEVIVPAGVQFIGRGGKLIAADGDFHSAVGVYSENASIIGLTIEPEDEDADAFHFGIIVGAGAKDVTVANNKIYRLGNRSFTPANEKGHGITVIGGAEGTKILYNTIRGIKGVGDRAGDGISLRQSRDTLIHGNTVDGGARMQIAVIDNAVNWTISDNHLFNGYLAGIDVEPNTVNSTGFGVISGNQIYNFGCKPAGLVGGQFFGIDLHSNQFENIIVTGNIITAVDNQSAACINAQNLARFAVISDNVMNCNGKCKAMLLVAGNGFENLVITNNIMREFITHAIDGYQNRSITVSDNLLVSGQDGTAGVYLVGCPETSITGNTIILTGATTGSGINITSPTLAVVANNIVRVADSVSGMICYANTTLPVRLVVTGNIVRNTNGTGTNGLYVYSAGAGVWPSVVEHSNVCTGFTNAFTSSGSVTFDPFRSRGGFHIGGGDVMLRTVGASPEGVVTAGIGSIALRTSGNGTGTTLYLKTTGAGNTGWLSTEQIIRQVTMPGPYADDAAAAAGGVAVDQTYRKTDGTLAWRQA